MENRNSAQFTYQATQISTATKEQLLLITYDIAIKSCRTAEAALDKKNGKIDFSTANTEIIRAQNVIRELMVTLNTERGGEMAQSLIRIYNYMYQLLVDANVKKEPENIRVVRGMLEDLKQTWEGALIKLLQEYQAAHPEDEELKSALSEIGTTPQSSAAPARPAAHPYSAAPAPKAPTVKPAAPQQAKAGGFTLAG